MRSHPAGLHRLLGDVDAFTADLTAELWARGFSREEFALMDHLCYRVETVGRYEELRGQLSAMATLLAESMVAGRRISTFQIDPWLQVGGWTVPYLELPEPKDASPYREGLEHAELVVIGGLKAFAGRHADLPFRTDGLTKRLNPELGLRFARCSVKFHELELGAVVRLEQRLGAQLGARA